MNRSKILQLMLGIMTKLNIKDKKLKYAVLGVLGLILATLTQLDEGSIAQVLQMAPEASSGSSDVTSTIINILTSLF